MLFGDRRRVLVEMTREGQERTWKRYEPMVIEGGPLLEGCTTAELELMLKHMVAIREITERYEERLRAR